VPLFLFFLGLSKQKKSIRAAKSILKKFLKRFSCAKYFFIFFDASKQGKKSPKNWPRQFKGYFFHASLRPKK